MLDHLLCILINKVSISVCWFAPYVLRWLLCWVLNLIHVLCLSLKLHFLGVCTSSSSIFSTNFAIWSRQCITWFYKMSLYITTAFFDWLGHTRPCSLKFINNVFKLNSMESFFLDVYENVHLITPTAITKLICQICLEHFSLGSNRTTRALRVACAWATKSLSWYRLKISVDAISLWISGMKKC